MADIKQFKCPCCGGGLEFDSHSQQVTCPFCDSVFDVEDLKKFDEEIQENYNEEMVWDEVDKEIWAEEEANGMNLYHCDSCGGEIICDQNTSSTICPYCGNPLIIKGKLSGDLKPEIVIPFKLDQEQAKAAFKGYFKKKIFMPREFKKSSVVDECKSIYVPYWIYNADVDGRARFNGETVRRWEDSNYTYKETRHYLLVRKGIIAFDNVPVDASIKMPNDLMESIEPFDVNDHKEFLSGYLAGYTAERYDVSKEENQARANIRIKEGTIDALRSTINGYSNVSLKDSSFLLSNQSSKYALYPIWMLNVSWQDNKYIFAVNGDTGKVAGLYPISKLTVFLLNLSVLIVGFVLGFLFGLLATEEVVSGFIGGLVFGVLALIISLIVCRNSIKKRVSFVHGAKNYVRKDSFSLYEKKDFFLYKTVSRTKKSNTSSSTKK